MRSFRLDNRLERWAQKYINQNIIIQGNLDPASLIPDQSKYLKKSVLSILEIMNNRKFIFNVGHGLTPDCKIKMLIKLLK